MKFKIIQNITSRALIPLLILTILSFSVTIRAQDETVTSEETISGLNSSVTVSRDEWGIPTIRAENDHDLFMGLGYAMASDRLWQMDGSRRLARGRVAEVAGAGQIQWDTYHRTMGLGRIAEESVSLLDEETRDLLQSFADGVNEYIKNNPANLGVEFILLGYQPEAWEIVDSLAIMKLVGSWLGADGWDEEMYGMIRNRLGEEAASELFRPVPDTEPGLFQDDPPDISCAERIPCISKAGCDFETGDEINSAGLFDPMALISAGRHLEASNIWAVDGSLTESGEPILAMDPHLNYFAPSIIYEFILDGGSFHCWGATFPGMPAIPFGANEDIAWGASNLPVDTQDLVIYSLNPDNENEYMLDGEWVPLETRVENIPFIDQEGDIRYYILNVHSTAVGPVTQYNSGSVTVLKSTSLEPSDDVTPLFTAMRAENLEEFHESFRQYKSPAQNFICAERGRNGRVGQTIAGLIPVRSGYSGTYPVNGGDSSLCWSGFISFDDLPHNLNPAGGWVAHANNMPSGGLIDGEHVLGSSFTENFRVNRIIEMIIGNAPLTFEENQAMQMDTKDLSASFFTGQIVRAYEISGDLYPELSQYISLLADWDSHFDVDSVAATIYQAWLIRFAKDVVTDRLPWELSAYLGYQDRWQNLLVEYLKGETSIEWLLPDGEDARLQKVLDSLDAAINLLAGELGTDMNEWNWGNAHHATFPHPSGMTGFMGGGEHPFGGSRYTVSVGHFVISGDMPYLNDFGAVFRAVAASDGDTWRIGAVLPPGQGGNVLSRHFTDQMDMWLNGELRDVYFCREFEESTELILLPVEQEISGN